MHHAAVSAWIDHRLIRSTTSVRPTVAAAARRPVPEGSSTKLQSAEWNQPLQRLPSTSRAPTGSRGRARGSPARRRSASSGAPPRGRAPWPAASCGRRSRDHRAPQRPWRSPDRLCPGGNRGGRDAIADRLPASASHSDEPVDRQHQDKSDGGESQGTAFKVAARMTICAEPGTPCAPLDVKSKCRAPARGRPSRAAYSSLAR